MITLTEISSGKLMITKDGSHFNPPFTSKSFGDNVSIFELQPNPGSFSAPYTQFEKSDSSTFADVTELMTYLTPFMGFNTASGGSGAGTLINRINLDSTQILTLGSNPIELLPVPPLWMYYEIVAVTLKLRPGAMQYSSEKLNLYGCFTGIVRGDILTANVPVFAVAKESFMENLSDGGNYYTQLDISPAQTGLYLSTYSGDDPIDGTGIMQIVVEYKLQPFQWE